MAPLPAPLFSFNVATSPCSSRVVVVAGIHVGTPHNNNHSLPGCALSRCCGRVGPHFVLLAAAGLTWLISRGTTLAVGSLAWFVVGWLHFLGWIPKLVHSFVPTLYWPIWLRVVWLGGRFCVQPWCVIPIQTIPPYLVLFRHVFRILSVIFSCSKANVFRLFVFVSRYAVIALLLPPIDLLLTGLLCQISLACALFQYSILTYSS